MALPKINEVPKYKITIPSTQQQVMYRPYLVKEEKLLMLAFESQDQSQILNAVTDTIKSCVFDELNVKDLTTFDVEYLFLQIRSKSVGEKATVSTKCPNCSDSVQFTVNLDDITVSVPDGHTNKIPLTDKIILKMKWPSYNIISGLVTKQESITNMTFDMIIQCMDCLMTDDEVINFADEPRAEIVNFLEALTRDQFAKIRDYIDNIPKLTHKVDVTCGSCNHHFDVVLEGINDFF